jgi:SLT domain-containing protein
MSDQSIEIRITAKNLTADEFAKARKEIAGLSDETNKSNKSAKDGELSWSKFGGALKDVGAVALKAGGIVAGAIGGMVAGIVELGKRGAEVNDVRENFDLLNSVIGNDSKQVMTTLSTAVDGMVSKFELMKITNQGLSQGLKLTNDDFKTVGEGARVLAERIGGDTKGAYEALIAAMASGKTLRLKEVGLNIDETQAIKDHAAALHVDASELNEFGQKAAKQQAIMAELTRILHEGGRATMDFGDTFERIKTKVVDFTDDLASSIAQSKVLGVALGAVGDIFEAIFGGDNQQLIKTIVHLIEQGAITLVEWGRTGVSIADAMSRGFFGLQMVFNGVMSVVTFGLAKISSFNATIYEQLAKLPGIGAGFKDVAASARDTANWLDGAQKGFHDAAEQALEGVQGNSEFKKTLDKIDQGLEATRNKMVDAMAATEGQTEAVKKNTGAHQTNHGEVLATNKLLDEYHKKVRELTSGLSSANTFHAPVELIAKQFGQTITDVVQQASILGQKVPTIIRDAFLKMSLKDADIHMAKELEDLQKNLEEKIKKSAERQNAALLKNLDAEIDAERGAVDIRNKLTLNSYDYQKTIIEREKQDKIAALDETGENYKEALTAIEHETDEKMAQAARDWQDHLAEMDAATNSWRNLTIKWIGSIPDLLKQAFTGGGGLGGALKALVSGAGGDIGGKLFEAGGLLNGLGNKLTGGVTKLLGQGLGDAFGLALPGIGQAIGALAGPLIGKLGGAFKSLFGGVSAEEKKGREAVQAFEKQLASTLTTTQKAAAGNEQWKMTVIGVRDAYLATGHSEAEAEAAVKRLWDSSKKGAAETEAAIKAVQDVMDEQKKDQEDLQAAIQKYGFTIDQLGPTMRRQQLTEQAVGLENDFRLLVGSGIDVNTVLEKMGGSINDFIHLAMRTGSEVPAEMKPMLEKMVEMGQLTDANGNKIENLDDAGLSFSETMTQGFDRIVKKLDEVFTKFLGIGDAVNSIPRNVDIEVNGRYNGPDIPTYEEAGIRGDEMPGHASGGLFTKAHVAKIAEAGKPEMVGDADFMANALTRAIAAVAGMPGASASEGQGKTVVFNITTPNPEGFRQMVYKEIGPKFLDWLAGNKGGSQTDLKEILGLT